MTTSRSSPSSTSTCAAAHHAAIPRGQVYVRGSVATRARSRVPSGSLGRHRHVAAGGPAGGRVARRPRRGRLARRPRRRRRRGVELVWRWAAVGSAAGPPRRRRPFGHVRLADRRDAARAGRATHRVAAAGAHRPDVRSRQREVLRRVPRRDVGTRSPEAMLDLAHVGCWPADPRGEVGRAPRRSSRASGSTSRCELEATTWTLEPGHMLRLAIAGHRLAELLAAARAAHPRGRRELGAPAAADRRRRLPDSVAEFVARRGPERRRGRRRDVADRARRARA